MLADFTKNSAVQVDNETNHKLFGNSISAFCRGKDQVSFSV